MKSIDTVGPVEGGEEESIFQGIFWRLVGVSLVFNGTGKVTRHDGNIVYTLFSPTNWSAFKAYRLDSGCEVDQKYIHQNNMDQKRWQCNQIHCCFEKHNQQIQYDEMNRFDLVVMCIIFHKLE